MKKKTSYHCTECGHTTLRWMGKCPKCHEFGTLEEVEVSAVKQEAKAASRGKISAESGVVSITDVKEQQVTRHLFDIPELDRVLGGGLVPGSLVLLGGDPGIGKSTLSLQAAAAFAKKDRSVLYVSGEESLQQTRMRAKRINALHPKIGLLAEIDIERVKNEVETTKPSLLVVDSIQSVFCPDIPSTPGSVNQIREATGRLLHLAKKTGVPVVLIGHVTKSGAIAGPKVLEHLVDTVLYFEGERGHSYRILRSVKNRFGATHEIGVFEMKEGGLEDVLNPSMLFLDQRPKGSAGSVVTICMEGSRPLLVEVQALVGNPAYGTPRRTCTGVDSNRVAMLVAVLEKNGGLQIAGSDIFVNVAGGYKLEEPAADMAIAAALASSFLGVAVPYEMAMFGEIGLAGEIRGVSQAEIRLKEAMKLGFPQVLMPDNNLKGMGRVDDGEITAIRSLAEGMAALFPAKSFV
jgi:DNA repair protein RadA/Sms